MKIRIKGNSIRLRLSQIEVQLFDNEGIVKEETHFGMGNTQFLYALVSDENAENINAVFQNNEIRVIVPEQLGNDWAKTDTVGISAKIPINEEQFLAVLIEKDFKCLTVREGEDESDNFPNPNEVC
jgi:hypothetical protein